MRTTVLGLLSRYGQMWDGTLGTIKEATHRIEFKSGSRPVYTQPYRAGLKARAQEEEEITRMLSVGVIEPARCEWTSTIVLVPKSDGSLRFCVDYRRLNALTVREAYPLPRMDECIDSLGDATVFTTLECNSGYWQIPVHPDDRNKTTFTSHFGTFRFTRMPFGLRNAPAMFQQRAVDIILAGIKWKSCLVYLDNVIVFPRTLEQHFAHLREVLELLKQAGITLKLPKCKIFCETVDYLGHVIRPGRLALAGKNTRALQEAEHPQNQTELRSFLGLCNVYRRFVPRFASVAAPLNELLKKHQPVEIDTLNPEQTEAFRTLKDALLKAPILALPSCGLIPRQTVLTAEEVLPPPGSTQGRVAWHAGDCITVHAKA